MAQRLKYYDLDVDFASSYSALEYETITFSYEINYKEGMGTIKSYMLHVVRTQ